MALDGSLRAPHNFPVLTEENWHDWDNTFTTFLLTQDLHDILDRSGDEPLSEADKKRDRKVLGFLRMCIRDSSSKMQKCRSAQRAVLRS